MGFKDMEGLLENRIEQLQKLKKVGVTLRFVIEKHAVCRNVHIFEDHIIFKVNSLEELHELRSDLRRALPSWDDHAYQVWTSMGQMLQAYSSETCPEVEIWLSLTPQQFEHAFGTDDCRVVKEERTETTYRFVCDKGKGEHELS